MNANVRKALGLCSEVLMMRPETRSYPTLKVMCLADIKDIPAAVGDWTREPVESRNSVEVSSGWVKLKLVSGAAEPSGVSVVG